MRAILATIDRRVRRRGPRSRGQSLVEFALILPVFLMFFGAVLDLGRVAAAQITVTNVAREAAFQAAETPDDFDNTQGCPSGATTNKVVCRALLEAKDSPISVSPGDLSLSCSPTCSEGLGNRVTVSVVGHFRLVTPILAAFFGGTQDLAFTASTTHQIKTLPGAPTPPPPLPSLIAPSPSASPTPTPTATSPACNLPSAGFTHTTSPASLKAPVTINLNDTSTSTSCGITSWFWVATNVTTGAVVWTDNVKSPAAHTFITAGTYHVTLTVANAAGSNTTGAIEVKVKP